MLFYIKMKKYRNGLLSSCLLLLFSLFSEAQTGIISDSAQYDKITQKAEYYLQQYQLDSAEHYLKKIESFKRDENVQFFTQKGDYYLLKGNYNKSLEMYHKAVLQFKNPFFEKNKKIATLFHKLGEVYQMQGEYFLALDYHSKAFRLRKQLYSPNDTLLAASYTFLGHIYSKIGKYNFSLQYLKNALSICKKKQNCSSELLAKNYLYTSEAYIINGRYTQALKYIELAGTQREKMFSQHSPEMADIYMRKGIALSLNKQAYPARNELNKALSIYLDVFGYKHPKTAAVFYQLGNTHKFNEEYRKALAFYQKSLAANLPYFNDSTEIYSKPVLVNYFDQLTLLETLLAKAESLERLYLTDDYEKDLKVAVQTVQLSDLLIDKIRRSHHTEMDKIAIGPIATNVYEQAISILQRMYYLNKSKKFLKKNKYFHQAFYSSEKNKASTLLGELREIEAQKHANIPDTLVNAGKIIRTKITLLRKQLVDNTEESKADSIKDLLFAANRELDALISLMEKRFPEYYKYKYSSHTTALEDIQARLDWRTAMRSYFVGDTTIYIFTLTNNKTHLRSVPKMQYFDMYVEMLRDMIIQGYLSGEAGGYPELAHKIYQQLFPGDLSWRTKNLIIIPDGSMGIIPFEALLAEQYNGDPEKYSDYPFLLKKYTISYTYSANLFYRSVPLELRPTQEDMRDFLALAPVFTDEKTSGVSLRTRSLLASLDKNTNDSTRTRGRMLEGKKVSPLPGTEDEVKAIFDKFEKKNKQAVVQTHEHATESYIQSGKLSDYRYIHIATHGFVNSSRPELSGILLAEDSTSTNDGILYSGEIYNLKLNSDLVVLSACETGLGKISKGEGVIGLSRALFYAGTRNIMVSLWKVADNSTANLMIDFYKDMLDVEKSYKYYGKHLRNAKLKMVKDNKYGHPYYWSPFILIGR